jgi:hypothetical protein
MDCGKPSARVRSGSTGARSTVADKMFHRRIGR